MHRILGPADTFRRLAMYVVLGLIAYSVFFLALRHHELANPEPMVAVNQDGTVDAMGTSLRPIFLVSTPDTLRFTVRIATKQEAERAKAGSFDRIAACQGYMLVAGDTEGLEAYQRRATAIYTRLGVNRRSTFAGDPCHFMKHVEPFIVRQS